MTEKITNEIKELEWDLNRLISAEKRLHLLEHEISVLTHNVHVKSLLVEKELADVQRLEKLGVYRLFATILKNTDAQLEKERQEYLMVVLDYQASAKELDLLLYEQQIIQEKLLKKSELKDKLMKLLKKKELNLMKDLGILMPKVVKLNLLIEELNQQTFELDDNIMLCTLCIESLEELNSQLKQIKIWGFPHQFSTPTRLSYKSIQLTKEAPKLINNLKVRLSQLSDQLKAIDSNFYPKYSFKEFDALVQNYQQMMLNDWLAQNRLFQIKTSLLSLGNMLKNLLKTLNDHKHTISDKIDHIEEEKRTLLEVI